MAVEIEFANVIVRKSALVAKYPGGLDAFAASGLPNYIEDEHLVRVGFMSSDEASDLAEGLTLHGLSFNENELSDIAIVQHDSHPDWLTIGPFNDAMGCWLTGTTNGQLVRFSNGFLLRCSRSMFDGLEKVTASIGVKVVRFAPGPEGQKDFNQVVHFTRGIACIEANVVGDNDENSPVGLWACRDLSRHQYCADDIRLAVDVEAVLRVHGAED